MDVGPRVPVTDRAPDGPELVVLIATPARLPDQPWRIRDSACIAEMKDVLLLSMLSFTILAKINIPASTKTQLLNSQARVSDVQSCSKT